MLASKEPIDLEFVLKLPSSTTNGFDHTFEVIGSWKESEGIGGIVRLYRDRVTGELFRNGKLDSIGNRTISRGNDGKYPILTLTGNFENFQVLNGLYTLNDRHRADCLILNHSDSGAFNWTGSEKNHQLMLQEKKLYFVNNIAIDLEKLTPLPSGNSTYVGKIDNYLIIQQGDDFHKLDCYTLSQETIDNISTNYRHFIYTAGNSVVHRLTRADSLFTICNSTSPLSLIAVKKEEAIFWSYDHSAFFRKILNEDESQKFSTLYGEGKIPEVFSLDSLETPLFVPKCIDFKFIAKAREILNNRNWWQEYTSTLSNNAIENKICQERHLIPLIKKWSGELDDLKETDSLFGVLGKFGDWYLGLNFIDDHWEMVKSAKCPDNGFTIFPEVQEAARSVFATNNANEITSKSMIRNVPAVKFNDPNWICALPYVGSGIFEVVHSLPYKGTNYVILWDGEKLFYRSMNNNAAMAPYYKIGSFVNINQNLGTSYAVAPINFVKFIDTLPLITETENYVYQETVYDYDICTKLGKTYKIPHNDKCKYYGHFHYDAESNKVTHRLSFDASVPHSQENQLLTLIGIKKIDVNSYYIVCWNYDTNSYSRYLVDSILGKEITDQAEKNTLPYIFYINSERKIIPDNFSNRIIKPFSKTEQMEANNHLRELGWFLTEEQKKEYHQILDTWDGNIEALIFDNFDVCVAEFDGWQIGYCNTCTNAHLVKMKSKGPDYLNASLAGIKLKEKAQDKINKYQNQSTQTITNSANTAPFSIQINISPTDINATAVPEVNKTNTQPNKHMSYTPKQCATALQKFFSDSQIDEEIFDYDSLFPAGATSKEETLLAIRSELDENLDDVLLYEEIEKLSKIFLNKFSIEDPGALEDFKTQPFTPLDLYNCVQDWLDSDLEITDQEMRATLEWMINDTPRFFKALTGVLRYHALSFHLAEEATSAAYRVAAVQVRKIFASTIEKTIPESSIKEFFQTTVGREMLNWALGYGLGQIDKPYCQELAGEFRVEALASAGNSLMENIFSDMLKLLPPPARIALPEQEDELEEEMINEREELVQEL